MKFTDERLMGFKDHKIGNREGKLVNGTLPVYG